MMESTLGLPGARLGYVCRGRSQRPDREEGKKEKKKGIT